MDTRLFVFLIQQYENYFLKTIIHTVFPPVKRKRDKPAEDMIW